MESNPSSRSSHTDAMLKSICCPDLSDSLDRRIQPSRPSKIYLPNEILMQIIDQVEDQKTLASLALSSKTCHQIANPLLYSNVQVCTANLAVFLGTIISNSNLASLVRHFSTKNPAYVRSWVIGKEALARAQHAISLPLPDNATSQWTTQEISRACLFRAKQIDHDYREQQGRYHYGEEVWLEILLRNGDWTHFVYLAQALLPHLGFAETLDTPLLEQRVKDWIRNTYRECRANSSNE